MLYYKFQNYEEFKDMFGIIKAWKRSMQQKRTRYCWHM